MGKILIIVPAYNEEEVISKTISKLEEFTRDNSNIDYIIIDDGSVDKTNGILATNGANYITHPINLGIGEPFKTGIKYGLNNGYSKFINFDADGQHRLDNIHLLTTQDEVDFVVGSRFINERKPWTARMLGSRVLALAIRMRCGLKLQDPTSGFVCIMNEDTANFYISRASNKPEPSLYPKLIDHYTVKEVAVEMSDRAFGASYFNAYTSLHFMAEQLFMIILKG